MVVIYRERNCAKNYAKLHNKIISKETCIWRVASNHNSFRVLFDKIAADNLSFKIILNFCIENGQFCEAALCRPNCIDSTQFRSRWSALSAL